MDVIVVWQLVRMSVLARTAAACVFIDLTKQDQRIATGGEANCGVNV